MLRIVTKQNLREGAMGCALVLAAVGLLAAPEEAAAGAGEGLALCGNVIIPSLFPFFVLSTLVVDLGFAARLGRALEPVMRPLFRLSGSCAAALALGFIGGYPVGARTALRLYDRGQCTKPEAERLLAFCNNSGPAFILGVVGTGIFGSGRVGLLLYLTHTAASLLVGLLFRFYGGREGKTAPPSSAPIEAVRLSAAFPAAVSRALTSTLSICAFVVFFSVLLRLLAHFGILFAAARLLGLFGIGEEWARRLVAGALELTSGVASLRTGGAGSVPAAAFMLGWAGLSVHCQVLSFLGESGLSPKTYLWGKLLHGALAAALTAALTRRFPLAEPAAAYLAEGAQSIAALDFSAALTLSLTTALALWGLMAVICALALKKSSGKTPPHRI